MPSQWLHVPVILDDPCVQTFFEVVVNAKMDVNEEAKVCMCSLMICDAIWEREHLEQNINMKILANIQMQTFIN